MRDALQLLVWREACRHIDLQEAVVGIAALVGAHVPLAALVVRRIDQSRKCIEPAATALLDSEFQIDPRRADCTQAHMKRLVAWCTSGEPLCGPISRIDDKLDHQFLQPVVAELHGSSLLRDAFIVPLRAPDESLGIALLIARNDQRLTPADQQICSTVIEPLGAALENDRRLRELTAQREAAEADKRSLLSRLGREQLSDAIVGQDGGLRPVLERVDLVARSDMPVLILGETGSGKEVVARAIHTRSPRAEGPFMRINCGAIPPELIDSELFGHERGSFTGATGTRQGWFERADNGTLFLDEIGELPLAAQVRLLRVLQDGTFERVGGGEPLAADVRIVAATHRDLPSMIDQGRFREDLWYRIAAFPIRLPPLRERPEDIPAMASHFAARAAKRFGLPPINPGHDDVALLRSYAWPGNVREFAAVIDRATILGEGRTLEIAKALGFADTKAQRASQPPPAERRSAVDFVRDADIAAIGDQTFPVQTLDEAMRQHITQALRAASGRIEGPFGAAKVLKINPHTLRARMRKLGIEWKDFRIRSTEA